MTVPYGWLGAVGKLRRAKLEIEMALESIDSGETEWTAATVTNQSMMAIELLKEVYGLLPKKTVSPLDAVAEASPPGAVACFRMSDGSVMRQAVPPFGGKVAVPEGVTQAWVEWPPKISVDGKGCAGVTVEILEPPTTTRNCLITCKGDPTVRVPEREPGVESFGDEWRRIKNAPRANCLGVHALGCPNASPAFPPCPGCGRRETIQPGLATKEGVIIVGHCRVCRWQAKTEKD